MSDCVSLAYQRVQKVECTSPRPVLILGPLTDPVKEMLVKESPGKFCRCVLGEFAPSRCYRGNKSLIIALKLDEQVVWFQKSLISVT